MRFEPGPPRYYEFFAGGGMARAGLGPGWACLFANDLDPKKAAAYAANWGGAHLQVADVATLERKDLPGRADLAWASFPCQDLSLAGVGRGLDGARSGTFWPFWRLIAGLRAEGRAPPVVVLENVVGALTSHGGADFAAIGSALVQAGYRFGALVMDAAHFVPQSRPRLFLVALSERLTPPPGLVAQEPPAAWSTPALLAAHARLDREAQACWLWWALPPPPRRNTAFADILEAEPAGVRWHTTAETAALLALMAPLHREKIAAAQRAGGRRVGAVYRRTRWEDGVRRQRAEVRFDDVAGCLRTPAGGSSRQTLLFVEGAQVRSRLLSPREAARLMGLPDSYQMPPRYNDAYRLAGDGVAVPVVRFLAEHLLEPLLRVGQRRAA